MPPMPPRRRPVPNRRPAPGRRPVPRRRPAPRRKPRRARRLFFFALIILGAYVLLRTLSINPAVPVFGNLLFPQANTYTNTYGKKEPQNLRSFSAYQEDNYIIVWLDAGHGGEDPGTYTFVDGQRIYEKDIALEIVLMTYALFNESDSQIRIYLTRNDDSHMFARYRINQWNQTPYTIAKADLVVSIHADYYEGRTAQSVYGIRSFYNQDNRSNTGRVNITAAQFAQTLQDHLITETGARCRGINGNRGLLIPTYSTMPAILIEVGFLSHQEELAQLMTSEYRQLIARALYDGIVAAVNASQ